MANNRYVNTAIWKDPWFIELRLTEQHLFLYLLTNAQTNMHGVYEMSLREMAFDTTVDQEEVKRIFRDRFQPDGKAFYEMGWVVMKNFLKHQTYNPKTAKAVQTHFNSLPAWLRRKLIDPMEDLSIDYDKLCIAYGYAIDEKKVMMTAPDEKKPMHSLSTNSNRNRNKNSNSNINKPPISPAADEDEIPTGPKTLTDDGF